MNNHGKTYTAEVSERRKERPGSNVTLLRLRINGRENFQARAGQFILLGTIDGRFQMPRPFTIVDIENNVISLLIETRGINTEYYSTLRRGDRIKIIGPNGSKIPFHPKVKSYVFVGGGTGGAALPLPAKEVKAKRKKIAVLLGGKDNLQLVGMSFFKEMGIKAKTITENGSARPGKVTDLLEKFLKNDHRRSKVIACGPPAMLKKIADLCLKYGNKGVVILEEIMACGMGSCMGCSILGFDGTKKRICSDGPAFDIRWIDWDNFMATHQPIQFVTPTPKTTPIDMRCYIKNVEFEYPIFNSSGGLSLEALEEGQIDYSKLGALVPKSITPKRSLGNKQPRVCETPSGMINAIGIENVGIDEFIRKYLHRWMAFGKPVFVSISANSVNEFVEMSLKLKGVPIVGIELNVSCPNIKAGGMLFGKDPEMVYKVTKAVRLAVPGKIIIVKLTPNVTDIVIIAKAAHAAGADALSLVNTLEGMAIDVMTRRPKIGNITGGLSGPAIRPAALANVYKVCRANLGIPIIGMGGIEDAESAVEFRMAGADIVAAATGEFGNRLLFTEIADGIEDIARYHGFTSSRELTGSLIFPA